MNDYSVTLTLSDSKGAQCAIAFDSENITVNGVTKNASEEMIDNLRNAIYNMIDIAKNFEGPVA